MTSSTSSHTDDGPAPTPYTPLLAISARSHRTWWQQRATIRGKTLLSVAATLLCVLIILVLLLRLVVLDSFLALEQHSMRTDVARATNTLTDTLQTLATLDESVAVWDDTYAFVAQPQQAYIDANWYESYFTQAQFNVVVITDASGQVVFSKAVDRQNGHRVPVPTRFQHLAPGDPLLMQPGATGTLTGVVLLDAQPMLIAAHAIVTSQGAGPARGTLLIGRYLDAQEITRLASVTQLALTIAPLTARPSSARQPTSADPVMIQPLTSDTIVGYQDWADLDGRGRFGSRCMRRAPCMRKEQRRLGIVSWRCSSRSAWVGYSCLCCLTGSCSRAWRSWPAACA